MALALLVLALTRGGVSNEGAPENGLLYWIGVTPVETQVASGAGSLDPGGVSNAPDVFEPIRTDDPGPGARDVHDVPPTPRVDPPNPTGGSLSSPLPSEPRALLGDASDLWRSGYRASSGPPGLESRLLWILLYCEGSTWVGYYGPFWTRAQFSADTYAKVVRYWRSLGLEPDPDDPYLVGLGVGWWARQVSDLASQWPSLGRSGC